MQHDASVRLLVQFLFWGGKRERERSCEREREREIELVDVKFVSLK